MHARSENQYETYLGHATIDNKVGAVDEAALIAGQEDDSVCLLNSLTEPSSREVDFTTVTLGLIITQPVLEERSAECLVRNGIR